MPCCSLMAGPSCGLGFDESTGPIELTCPLDSLIVLNKVFHLFFVIRVSFPSLSFNFCVVVVTMVVVDRVLVDRTTSSINHASPIDSNVIIS